MGLNIEVTSKDRYYDHLAIEGMTVEEIDYILNGSQDGKDQTERFAEVMDKYSHDGWNGRNVVYEWKYGFGIYSIKHFGGCLLVQIGNNCD